MAIIAICMWYNDEINDYADINRDINQYYCDKYGYDLIVSGERNCTDEVPVHFERFPLVFKYIEAYDWVVYIDSDAFLYADRNIIDLINEHKDKNYIFSADKAGKPHVWHSSDQINSGVFIVKSTPSTKEMLQRWSYSKDLHKLGRNNDQRMLNIMLHKNLYNLRDESIILDFGTLQHFRHFELPELKYKPFVRHCAGKQKDYRIAVAQKYNEELSNNNDPSTIIMPF